MKYLTAKEISRIYSYNFQTIRQYVSRSEFAKYRIESSKKIKILWCKETEEILLKFLRNIKRRKAVA